MPHIGDWWEAVSETVRATFLTLLQDIPSFSPIFLLSTSESMYSELPEEVSLLWKEALVYIYHGMSWSCKEYCFAMFFSLNLKYVYLRM